MIGGWGYHVAYTQDGFSVYVNRGGERVARVWLRGNNIHTLSTHTADTATDIGDPDLEKKLKKVLEKDTYEALNKLSSESVKNKTLIDKTQKRNKEIEDAHHLAWAILKTMRYGNKEPSQ